jgi:predicted SAM-dependent methyltransferase
MTSTETLSTVNPLGAYLQQTRYVPSSRLRAFLAPVIPPGLRPRARIWATDLLRPVARRQARALATRTPLQLHLGSGRSLKAGWINVDLIGDGADLFWNLLRPLPFPDGTADAIFHEHVLEHFDLAAGLNFCRECYRLLKPTGAIRVVVPDAEEYFERYRCGDLAPAHESNIARPTALLAAQEIFYRFGHRSAYDFETLRLLLSTSGFRDIQRSSFCKGTLGSVTDSRHRREGSLYCEATK